MAICSTSICYFKHLKFFFQFQDLAELITDVMYLQFFYFMSACAQKTLLFCNCDPMI